jgi:hypothetical protein
MVRTGQLELFQMDSQSDFGAESTPKYRPDPEKVRKLDAEIEKAER